MQIVVSAPNATTATTWLTAMLIALAVMACALASVAGWTLFNRLTEGVFSLSDAGASDATESQPRDVELTLSDAEMDRLLSVELGPLSAEGAVGLWRAVKDLPWVTSRALRCAYERQADVLASVLNRECVDLDELLAARAAHRFDAQAETLCDFAGEQLEVTTLLDLASWLAYSNMVLVAVARARHR